jgi:hypothetical protein
MSRIKDFQIAHEEAFGLAISNGEVALDVIYECVADCFRENGMGNPDYDIIREFHREHFDL